MALHCRLTHMQRELESRDQHAAALQQLVQSLQTGIAGAQQEQQQLQIQLQHARSALDTGTSEREYLQAEAISLQQALQVKSNAALSQQEMIESMSAQLQSKVRSVRDEWVQEKQTCF